MAELFNYGPKMAALTELQRNYIKAMASAPFATSAEWARMAGYSDSGKGAKVAAHRLRHDPKIEAAVLEYAAHTMHRDGPVLAVAGLMQIARDRNHPKQLRALETLANRVGLHERSEHMVQVQHIGESTEALVERIKRLAASLGLNAEQLLGTNMQDVTPKQIEGKAEHRPAGKGDGR